MTIEINKKLVERLYGIPWFQNCGEEIPNLGLKVSSKGEVFKRNSSLKWHNMVLDYQGDITSKLCLRRIHGEGDEEKLWNGLVDEWKTAYLPRVEGVWKVNLEKVGLNTKDINDMVRFCVLDIVMADAYKSIVSMDDFFINLFKIYESGHLPCGWSGKKDRGTVYIY